MTFKKKEIKPKKNNSKIINYLGTVLVSIFFLLSVFFILKINDFNFNISTKKSEKIFCENNNNNNNKICDKTEKNNPEALKIKKEEEKKEEERLKKILEMKKISNEKKQNILLIGRGGYGNDAPELTDSIILISYYSEKSHVSMFSIPRDLYVEYGDKNKNGKKISGKINGLYVHYLEKLQNKEKAIKKLEEKIEEITDEKIDFYINIDFNGFVKLINSVDGITINVPKNLYDDKYPDNNHGYQTFSLSKGLQKVYGNTALKYSRSRKNTGGDFGRSERQQQVIKALKDKVLSSKYLTDINKIKELYSIFNKYIETDIGVIDFTKIATSIKLKNDLRFYSSGLNSSCVIKEECDKGGFLFFPQRVYFGGQSVVLPNGATNKDLSNYEEIKKFSELVFEKPNIFKENFKISIFSNLYEETYANDLKIDLKRYGLKINNLEIIGKIPDYFLDINGGFGLKSKEEDKKNNNGSGNKKNSTTLIEYNNLKNSGKINTKSYYNNNNIKLIKTQNKIELESENKKTKIIINGVDRNSNTIDFLKKYLNIENEDIIENIGGPKYAKDKNTKIEILYKK